MLEFCDEWAISLSVTWIVCSAHAFLILMHALCTSTLKCFLINYIRIKDNQGPLFGTCTIFEDNIQGPSMLLAYQVSWKRLHGYVWQPSYTMP